MRMRTGSLKGQNEVPDVINVAQDCAPGVNTPGCAQKGQPWPGSSVPHAEQSAGETLETASPKKLNQLFLGSPRTDMEALVPQSKVLTIKDTSPTVKGDKERFYPLITIAIRVRTQGTWRSTLLKQRLEGFFNAGVCLRKDSKSVGDGLIHARPSGLANWHLPGGEANFSFLCGKTARYS